MCGFVELSFGFCQRMADQPMRRYSHRVVCLLSVRLSVRPSVRPSVVFMLSEFNILFLPTDHGWQANESVLSEPCLSVVCLSVVRCIAMKRLPLEPRLFQNLKAIHLASQRDLDCPNRCSRCFTVRPKVSQLLNTVYKIQPFCLTGTFLFTA